MNEVTLAGVLDSDPELRAVSGTGDRMIASALLLFLAYGNNGDVAHHIKVTVWRGPEDFAALSKGDRVLVSGNISIDTVDRGTYKEKRTEINVNSFELMGGVPSNPNRLATQKTVGVDFEKHLARKVAPIAAFDDPPVAQTYSLDYDDIPF